MRLTTLGTIAACAVILTGLAQGIAAPARSEVKRQLLGAVVTLPTPLRFDAMPPAGGKWRSAKIQPPDNSFGHPFRLHLRFISALSRHHKLVVRDADEQEVMTLSGDQAGDLQELWTGIIYSQFSRIELYGLPIGAVVFEIDRLVVLAEGPKEESIKGPDDRRHVQYYARETGIANASGAIARILYFDGEPLVCTGFLVARSMLLTNHHCIPSPAVCRTAIVEFNYQYRGPQLAYPSPQFGCREVITSEPNLDFTLLRLDGDPSAAGPFRPLTLSPKNPSLGEPLILIHHPGGEPKQVTLNDCKVTTMKAPGIIVDSAFGHSCDTLRGSSGSPVLDAQFGVVGLHHRGFDDGTPRWARENRAIAMSKILPLLQPYLGSK